MPLLRRKPFERSTSCQDLDDDEEVFHCEITNEIFKDYEEYCERIILVNSMVWSCELTGKPNLTYAEALESEKIAKKALKNFPMGLRVPMLYLASITKRSNFLDLSEDVYNFVRDKYFVGESVDVCLNGDNWCEANILTVIVPSNTGMTKSPSKFAVMYSYEVEMFEEEDENSDYNNTRVVCQDRIRRKRGLYSREKNKLFLKQFTEQGPSGIMQIKKSVMDKYNIANVEFDQIFAGSPPVFPSSKKFEKLFGAHSPGTNGINKNIKSRQESIAKYMTKGGQPALNGWNAKDVPNGKISKNSPVNYQKRREEEIMKKKERSIMLAAYIKEWKKQKDDLELEDHRILPKTVPVEIQGISNKYFGDIIAMLEFFMQFNKQLKLRDYFLHGIDIETLRRALLTREVAGPLSDIIQMLLGTIFSLQEEEADEYNSPGHVNLNGKVEEDDKNGSMTLWRAVQLASAATAWSQKYLSVPLNQLQMDSQTFSEILRLHLLTSGTFVGDNCAKWRYQQRGGYNSDDDPGLLLKIKYPHIIKALGTKHITQLPLSYKIKIINCLMSQILTYATIRDSIEENLEKSRNIKSEIRALQIAERKRESDYLISKNKIKKEMTVKKDQDKLSGEKLKVLQASIARCIEDLTKESELKKLEFEKKIKSLNSDCFSYQNYLGSDRAYRRYWMFESVQGIFVEHCVDLSGVCLTKPVIPNPALASAKPEDAISYVQRMFENELNGGTSDKENESDYGSPKKTSLDGSNRFSIGSDSSDSKLNSMQELLMCTADSSNCPVHSSPYPKTQWSFITSPEDFEQFISSLNSRGFRESELKQIFEQEKDQISKYITKTSLNLLNSVEFPSNGKSDIVTRLARRYVDANLRYPPSTETSEVLEMTLRDNLLDFEEKLTLSGLGKLHVKDRKLWRSTILNRGYDKQCTTLQWGPPNKDDKTKAENTYADPGTYLSNYEEINSDTEEDLLEDNSVVDVDSVRSLASALLQLGQAVSSQHLKRPLGYDEKEWDRENKSFQFDAYKRWEVSLMESTSFAQVNLHLNILDNSILWSRSILNANCRVCRKRNDDENMLLCDLCNKGHHIYCLKPKLSKIPTGDWFCNQCKPKEKSIITKIRKVFKEDEEESVEDENSNESWNNNQILLLCETCKSGGSLVQCTECAKGWHSECLGRPQRKSPFVCLQCSKPNKEKDSDSSEEPLIFKAKRKRLSQVLNFSEDKTKGKPSKRSRKSSPSVLETNYNSESSDEPISILKNRMFKEKNDQPVNGNSAKMNTRNSDSGKRNSTPIANGHSNGFRKTRRSEVIHQSVLEELVNDVMHHKDSWPFNAPVTVEEVPDYFEIITEPMDFETIKNKLKSGKYRNNAELMIDAALIFENCSKYNHDDDAVAKAGMRLQKFFEKRCKELNLVDSDADQQIKKQKLEN